VPRIGRDWWNAIWIDGSGGLSYISGNSLSGPNLLGCRTLLKFPDMLWQRLKMAEQATNLLPVVVFDDRV
jgi:hypothetical protein